MPQLALFLLRQPVLKQADLIYDLRLRKGIALLAILAVEGSPQNREKLATLLWAEYDQLRALANLRRTLYRLHQTPFAAWLRADDVSVALYLSEGDFVDATSFQTFLLQNTPGALEKAVSLYQDDFLSNFYLPDSSPFEEWSTLQRENYRRQMLDALHQLTEHYLRMGEFHLAEATSRRQLRLDNIREEAWRELMLALAGAGRRGEALAEYRNYCQVMFDELGVEPSAESQVLAETIRTASGPVGSDKHARQIPSGPNNKLLPLGIPGKPQETIIFPYKGMQQFTEEDAPTFFGRETFTELLVEAVYTQSILAVVGPSGCGKSSVIQAGLLAQVRDTRSWQIAYFRPKSRPFYSLAEVFVPYLHPGLSPTEGFMEVEKLAEALMQSRVALSELVHRVLEGQTVNQKFPGQARFLLVADQFEELYTLSPQVELQHRFLDILLEPVFQQQYQPEPNFTLVLALRSDFLDPLLNYRPLADAIQEGDVKLGPMSRPELSRAISNPARLAGVSFQPGLVERILDDLGEEPGRLPLLEFTLALLWERRNAGEITHEAYENAGQVQGALARYAEEIFSAMTASEQGAAQRIFVQLVRPGQGTVDTRRVAYRSELGEQDWKLVQRLSDARLLVTGSDAPGQETVEVVHEALLSHWPRLRDWMIAEREFRLWQERLRVVIETWKISQQDEGALLRGVALRIAEDWLTQRQESIGPAEQHFIKLSKSVQNRLDEQHSRQRNRRTKFLLTGLAVIILITIFSAWQWDRAKVNFRNAQRVRLAFYANSMLDTGSSGELPFLLALHSLRFGYSPEAQGILYRSLEHGFTSYVLTGHQPSVWGVDFSPDGRWLLSSGSDGKLLIWDTATGAESRRLTGHQGFVRGSFSPDGRLIASAGGDHTVRLWDAQSGEELWQMKVHTDVINQVGFSPDGQFVLSTSDDHTARLWDTRTGALLQTYEGHSDWVLGMDFSPNGRTFLTGSRDMTVRVWDLNSGDLIRSIPHLASGTEQVQTVSYSPDGRYFLTVPINNTAYLWDSAQGKVIREFSREPGVRIIVGVISPDSRLLLTGSEDDRADLWDIESGQHLRSYKAEGGNILAVDFSPNGKQIATGSEDGTVRLWQIQLETEPRVLKGFEGRSYRLAFSPDGNALITSDDSEWVRLWDIQSGLQAGQFGGHTGGTSAVAFAPNGLTIATAAWDQTVRLWDLRTASERYSYQTDSPVLRMIFSPDGRQLLTGEESGLVELRNVESGDLMHQFPGHEGEVWSISFDMQGERFLTGSWDGTVILWEVSSGKELARFQQDEAVIAALFLPEDQRILTVDADWSARTWQLERRILEREFSVQSGKFSSAALSPDGMHLLVSGMDGVTRRYDLSSGEVDGFYPGHTAEVFDVAYSSHGKWIATAGWDGTVRLWQADMQMMIERFCSRLPDDLPKSQREKYGIQDDVRVCPE